MCCDICLATSGSGFYSRNVESAHQRGRYKPWYHHRGPDLVGSSAPGLTLRSAPGQAVRPLPGAVHEGQGLAAALLHRQVGQLSVGEVHLLGEGRIHSRLGRRQSLNADQFRGISSHLENSLPDGV